MELLDLELAGIVASEDELMQKNPELGNAIDLEIHSDRLNIENTGIHVKAAGGKLFRLNTDGTATPDVESLSYTGHKPGWEFARDWHFDNLKNEEGKHVHAGKTACSPERIALLKPELVPELNREAVRRTKSGWFTGRLSSTNRNQCSR